MIHEQDVLFINKRKTPHAKTAHSSGQKLTNI